MKRLILIRKATQVFFLILFLLTVLQANYPFNPWIPPELFLWLDPLAGLSTMFAGRVFVPWFLLSLIVLISPLLLGRSFCGWICPLGAIIDITDKFTTPRKKNFDRRWRHWKTFVLIFFLIAAGFGLQIAWLMDPLPLLWRTFGAVIFPVLTMLMNRSFDLIIQLGWDADWLYNAYDLIALHILPLHAVLVRSALAVALMFLLILGLGRLSKRFWCRNLCPLGGLLGIISKSSRLQRVVESETCASCKLCTRDCKMNAINDDYLTTEKSECIFCLNCSLICKAGKTTYAFRPASEMASPVDMNRKQFIYAGAWAVAGVAGLQIIGKSGTQSNSIIRPPGAQSESLFLDRCIRCNECVRICSTTGKTLQPVIFEAGIDAMWTPRADFISGYCEYTCNLCGEICPTGAIQKLPLEEKKQSKMGVAVFNENLCLPFAEKENCLVCEEHCPTPEKAIIMEEKPTVRPDGTEFILLQPKVIRDRCIGCGICVNKCPIEPQRAVAVIRDT